MPLVPLVEANREARLCTLEWLFQSIKPSANDQSTASVIKFPGCLLETLISIQQTSIRIPNILT